MDEKNNDFKSNLKSYISDDKIQHDGVVSENESSDNFEKPKSDNFFEDVNEKYTSKQRKEDNDNYENYKQNDSPDWYLKAVKFIYNYSKKIYDFYAATKHGIIYSFLTSGVIAAVGNMIWANATKSGTLGQLTKVFRGSSISLVTLITVPFINYLMTRFIYLFTKKYMRPTPPPCTRDVKGGVFSIINQLFMFVLTPLGFIGSILGCFTGMLAYSASFMDLVLEKDSFKVGLKSFLAQLIISIIVFLIGAFIVGIIAFIMYNTISNGLAR
ncbi:hypothetical protein [uncultured Finegoldia sp.]|uniref:hypothetical protein n=1 Tax=uncultured Finegoldia sp. TaxID=328009 RepID=UPI002618AC70|nr:hypothetical protein [uncultured Finegoldia sp.]